MGSATLVAYGRKGDHFRFYEIDPDMVEVAKTQFTYLSETRAAWDVTLGDARLRLEEEADNRFDLLVLDAFSSDAIPVHLLTVEAMKMYHRHLTADGIVAVHVTNRYLDLEPAVVAMARAFEYRAVSISNTKRMGNPSFASLWILLTSDESLWSALAQRNGLIPEQTITKFSLDPSSMARGVRPWTDDYSNLFQILLYSCLKASIGSMFAAR
jgi:spermidine synthase